MSKKAKIRIQIQFYFTIVNSKIIYKTSNSIHVNGYVIISEKAFLYKSESTLCINATVSNKVKGLVFCIICRTKLERKVGA